MRIAYVTIHVAHELMQGGVGRKIRSQISFWRERGHEVSLFSLTPEADSFSEEHQFVFNTKTNLLKREISRASFLMQMIAAVREYKPDVIYMRYGLYSYPLHRLFRVSPVVVEINTNDIVEYATRGIFFYWANRLTRSFTLKSAAGIVSPTQELTHFLPRGHRARVIVIANGADLSAITPLPAPQNNQPVVTLVGSPGMNWHGVDKLLRFAELTPDVVVNIVGYSRNDLQTPVPSNVRLFGFLGHDGVREVLAHTDVALGTLALHRKQMQEASALKVRESLMYGIPVVIAYRDTDLHDVHLDTILRIPNTEENVNEHAEQIRQFAYRMMGRRVDIHLVAPYLDQRKKEDMRLAFFEQIKSTR